jgi:CubicO group peptidase (beta-lactamase class C family)
VMMLEEEGKLSLDDPVGKHIPELASLKGPDGRQAVVTIRQLLTHTSGMAEISDAEAKTCTKLADTIPLYAAKPLKFEPGMKWEYCQSSINTAARIVEIVSGQTFPEFLKTRLFKPLGMKDTTFYLSEEQSARLAKSYSRTAEGKLEETNNFILLGQRPSSRQRFPAANGGLFSTAQDYARFCRMILNMGELDGRRYLKAETVRKMTTNQIGNLVPGFTPGNAWGIGWCVVWQPQGLTEMLSPGTHGHGGAYGTQAWIDPVKDAAYILMVQRANFPNSDASPVRKVFQEWADHALAETRKK